MGESQRKDDQQGVIDVQHLTVSTVLRRGHVTAEHRLHDQRHAQRQQIGQRQPQGLQRAAPACISDLRGGVLFHASYRMARRPFYRLQYPSDLIRPL